MSILSSINRWLRPVLVKGTNNTVTIRTTRRKNFIVRVYGNNNTIEIGKNCRLIDTEILILGDNNHLYFEDVAKMDGPVTIQLAGNATLRIGTNSGVRGVSFYVKDGRVVVGRDCMFSYGVTIRNNDSHQMLNNDGAITNYPGDITIGDHVWFCQNSSIIKSVTIGSDSVIGYGAVVVKSCPDHSVMAGNPARIVKTEANWCNKPIPFQK